MKSSLYRTVITGHDTKARPKWLPLFVVEVRLQDGTVWRHFKELYERHANNLLKRVEEANVASREELDAKYWTKMDSTVWSESTHSGRYGGGMYRYTVVASTSHELEEWGDKLCSSYHPMGYGTIVRNIEKRDGLYYLTASRSGSCD